MTSRLLIDTGLYETRAAMMDNDRLTDLSYFRPDTLPAIGEIYLGRISALAKGLDAAFVDLGSGNHGFLLARDVPATDKNLPLAQKVREGQKIIVQIIKDKKGDKDYQLSAFPKLESRNLVFNPSGRGLSFSKKLKNETVKDKIRTLLSDIADTMTGGIMVRSAVSELSVKGLKKELLSLLDRWQAIQKQEAAESKTRCLAPKASPSIAAYEEYATEGLAITINDRDGYNHLREFLSTQGEEDVSPILWHGTDLLFDAEQIEEQIEAATEKTVALPSGGNITIEQTEALVVIDVNSGAQTETKKQASIALLTNQEAARLAAQQIRLRNLSGIIIIDFIQMQDKGGVRALTRLLEDQTRDDPSAVRIVGMTELGLMQLTRQRKAASLTEQHQKQIETSSGTLPINLASTLIRDIMRYRNDHKSANVSLKTGLAWTPFLKTQKAEIEKHLSLNIFWEETPSLNEESYQLGG